MFRDPMPKRAVFESARDAGGVLRVESPRTSRDSSREAAPRGRPPEMPPAVVLERIQKLAERREGLFRIHRTHRDLYARARRQFGSWAAAVKAAGLDYESAMRLARTRSIENRKRGSAQSRRLNP